MTQPLSPAAQAVLSAAHITYWCRDDVHITDPAFIAAAVVRAAGNQVVPEPSYRSPTAAGTDRAVWAIRDQLLAIAAELEGLGGQLGS